MSFKSFSTAQDAPDKIGTKPKPKGVTSAEKPPVKPANPQGQSKPSVQS
ncbi:MAG: hypothetical protein HQL69_16125 [Magnetococcales bacterium]|nr:hypothetical protein [Magnetococcales bacterium]